jgi:hypothetical protein
VPDARLQRGRAARDVAGTNNVPRDGQESFQEEWTVTTVDAKLVTVVQAIKQAIETSSNPGLSVNAHPNAFFLNVNGAVDLMAAARLVIVRLESFEQSMKARFDAEVQSVMDKIEAEFKAGAVSMEDAIARIKAKAGGEFIAAEGAVETALANARAELGKL